MHYEPHPANLAFPYLAGESWKRFLADLEANGLRDAIVIGRGDAPRTKVVLDGKIRLRACEELDIEPRFEDYDGDDQFAYIISRNLARRQLNESQRAMVALRLSTFRRPGRPVKSRRSAELSAKEASHLMNVGERTVQRAGIVTSKGVPELVRAVDAGDITIDAAAELARQGKRKQLEAIVAATTGASVRSASAEVNRLSLAVRLNDSDLHHLGALAECGSTSRDPHARAGVVVLRRLVPALGAR